MFLQLTVILLLLGFIVFYPALYKIASSPTGNETETASFPIRREIQTPNLAFRNESSHACLRNEFSNVVLVIVFNFPHYSNIPLLTELYKNAFPTIMFCGSEKATGEHTVEAADIQDGIFGYICVSRAIHKHPGYSGYLLISDDVILNYWTLVGLNRDQLWEGPQGELQFQELTEAKKQGVWWWWGSQWGRKACENSLNEIKTFTESNSDERLPEVFNNHTDNQTHPRSMVWNMKKAIDILRKNQNGTLYCINWHADAFYIPGRFADAYIKLSAIFYKHRTFLEIAVPMIFRLIDFQENFEYFDGIYLARRPEEGSETRAVHFWEVYNKTLAFVHPFKLNAKADGTMNSILLRKWIIEHSDSLSKCEKK